MNDYQQTHSGRFAGASWRKLCGVTAIAALAGPALAALPPTATPGAAFGQQMVADQPVANSGRPATGVEPAEALSPVSWKYGDWRGFFTATAQLRYDDNILQKHENGLADFSGVAAPAFNVEYVPANAETDALLHLDYAPEFVGYLEHREFNAINHLAHLKAERAFGRSQFRLSHALRITTEPAMEQTGRGRTHNEATEFSWAYQATEKTALTLTPYQDWMHINTGLTVWEYGATLELGHRLTEKTTLLASYAAAEVTSNPGSPGFKQSVLAGFSWEMSGLCRLDATAGFQTMSISGGNASGGSVTPDLSVNWSYQFAPKTGLRLRVRYDNNYSRYIAYQVNETLAGELVVSHALTPKIGLELRGGAQSVKQKAAISTASSGGEVFYWNLGGGVVYHFNLKTDFRLDFNHQERGSSQLYDPFTRNLVQLEIQRRF